MNKQSLQSKLMKEYDYEGPVPGQLREALVIDVQETGTTLDLGLKRDGFLPREDIERMDPEDRPDLDPGDEVMTCIVDPDIQDGLILVSAYEVLAENDWIKAKRMLEEKETWQGAVTGYNRGGLLLDFCHLEAFLPASHLWHRYHQHQKGQSREQFLQSYVGKELSVVFIEADRDKNRLVVSERKAKKRVQKENMDRLLRELREGEIVRGTVGNLADFGAFVDLGGASGLVHISELAWEHIRHPSEVVQVGEEVKVYVLDVDREKRRIGLSLKRLIPSPWFQAEERLSEGQLISGVVTNVLDFGAFIDLEDIPVDGLLHVSEISDDAPVDAREVLRMGEEVLLRVLRVDPLRQRIRLSHRRVAEWEREKWRNEKGPFFKDDVGEDMEEVTIDGKSDAQAERVD